MITRDYRDDVVEGELKWEYYRTFTRGISAIAELLL